MVRQLLQHPRFLCHDGGRSSHAGSEDGEPVPALVQQGRRFLGFPFVHQGQSLFSSFCVQRQRRLGHNVLVAAPGRLLGAVREDHRQSPFFSELSPRGGVHIGEFHPSDVAGHPMLGVPREFHLEEGVLFSGLVEIVDGHLKRTLVPRRGRTS